MARSPRGGTPATIALTKAGTVFRLHPYAHHPDATSYGEEAAEALGVDPQRVFKTLVVDAGALVVAILPVAAHLDLKAVADAVRAKRAALATPETAARATGYVVGGISPLGQRTSLRTLVDRSAEDHTTMFVSAGRRGLQVELAPADLIRLTGAELAAVAGWGCGSRVR